MGALSRRLADANFGGFTDMPKISLSLIINLAAGLAFLFILVIAIPQSIGETETRWTGDAARATTVGETVEISPIADLIKAAVNVKTDDQFVTTDGRVVFYDDLVFVRVGERSVPGEEWTPRDPTSRLEQLIPLGKPIYYRLKSRPAFTTTISAKTADGVVVADGSTIRYQNIGYIKRWVPFYIAYPRNILRDIIIVPLFLLWAVVDLMTAFDYRH